MPVKILKVLFILACIFMGGCWAGYLLDALSDEAIVPRQALPFLLGGGILGGLVSALVVFGIRLITQDVFERLMPALVAVILGLIAGRYVATFVLYWMPEAEETFRIYMTVTFVLLFGFLGMCLGLTHSSNWKTLLSAVERHKPKWVVPKLVDTSVIIDGRISDICESGFMEGTLLIPRFVLAELQHIADSADVLRRAKGRRGLDILQALQGSESRVEVEIIDHDPKEVREVDAKLVKLAKQLDAKVLTNDFNLNKVAQIEGIQVLNINDLANALKPMVLPDEKMEVKIIKEGKEPSQGVGYLDDGTMVVVDGGRIYMTQKVEVIVTSVLQTAAGRMIFTRFSSELT